jgi:acetyl esterase
LTAPPGCVDAYPMLDPDIRKLLDTVFVLPTDATAPDVQALRASAESAAALLGEAPEPVAVVRDVMAAGTRGRRVPLRLYDPSVGSAKPLMVFAHGGGWVTGSLDSHDRLCRMLANRLDAIVAAVDYTRAPEHRYPAALDDVDAAWHWCKEEARALHADSTRMAVAGDSSGGNLAAALAIRLRARREAQPVLQLLFYPALDARAASASYDTFGTGHNLRADMMRWHWKAYAPDGDPDDPELSPLAASDHSGLAPAIVAWVHADVLRDDGLAYARKLEAAGVPTQTIECPGMIHGFLRWSGAVPAARGCIDAICAAARPMLHGPAQA